MDLPWKWIERKWISQLKVKKESKNNEHSIKNKQKAKDTIEVSNAAITSEAELLKKFRLALKQKKSNLPPKVALNPIEEINTNEI